MFRKKLFRNYKTVRNPEPTRYLVFGFLGIIFLGAILLSLPISSNEGTYTPFLNSLFTSTSATCVTGLVVYDTYTHWNIFGRTVIICLIQIGGLGFMTFAGLLSLVVRKGAGLKSRMLMAQSLNLFDMNDVLKMIKTVVVGTFTFEGAAALVLSVRFIPEYGFWGGIGRGVFISISAFCNAGFDLMGNTAPFSSLTDYSGDIVVNLTVMALIFIGGLGFFVWSDIYDAKSFKKLSVFSKLILIVSFGLLFFGAVCFFVFEYSNPETMADLSFRDKILASFFQSVTARTAGFNTINLGGMTDISVVIMCMLMFVGGSSGSTAGGVKVGTVTVAAYAVISAVKGESNVNVMKRRFSRDIVMQSFALVSVSFVVIIVGTLAVSAFDGIPFLASLFEVTSAFCTVGVSVGITPTLSPISLCLLMILMFLGRVGLMTATYAIFLKRTKVSNKIQYPEVKMIIG